MKIHQIWIGNNPAPKRYIAYAETVKKYNPDCEYIFWDEDKVASLGDLVVPECLDKSLNPILRSDILRLEILRQFGGLYLDIDFEFLKYGSKEIFDKIQGFAYSDYNNGHPSNALMYAGSPFNDFVSLYLWRIKMTSNFNVSKVWNIPKETGPNKLSECLWFYVGKWNAHSALTVSGVHYGNNYADGKITAIKEDFFIPYKANQDVWATFDPNNYPLAIGAHHHHQKNA